MKVLITGSEGYIGSSLCFYLSGLGYEVVGLDTIYYKNNLGKLHKHKIINKDIRDIKKNDIKGFDCIVHLAALSNDPTGDLNPKLTQNINFRATIKLAKLAKKNGIKRFIFSSSCSIYGIGKEAIVSENSPVNPLTAYAKSKINTENKLKELVDKNFFVGLLRNSTVYGYAPMFRDDLVLNNFTTCAYSTKEIRIMSDGTPWRPLIDIRDLCNIFELFLTTKKQSINGKVINIGFDENNLMVKDLANIVKKCIPKCQVVYTGEHSTDSRSYKVSFKLFKSFFPEYKQIWHPIKSVKNLIVRLKEFNFKRENFLNKKYQRIIVINKLLKKKLINNDLEWVLISN